MTKNKNTMKYFEETEKVKRDVYYHYTSVSSLYNIVNSKTFWLTNLKSSNDKKELSYSLPQFKKELYEIIEMEDDGETKHNLSLAQTVFEQFPKINIAKSEAYALSLCHKKDDLTHWDRYAGNCSGVAIAINVAALKVYYSRKGLFSLTSGLLPVKGITYSKKDRQTDIYNAIRAFLNFSSSRTEGNNDNNLWERSLPRFYYSIYYNIRNFVKMDAFMDEDEVRLFFRPDSIKSIASIINSFADSYPDKDFSKVGLEYRKMIDEMRLEGKYFAYFKNGIRSYRKLCLSEIWGNGLIPEIILGPMCTQDKKELRTFLDSCGLKGTKIVESKVPIR